tara:strand:- start:305 stop:628 length:324 start_codon:yes stop_codon:yes gene_type:complete
LGEEEGEGESPGRIAVRFISRRVRLLDPDNLTPKYVLDGLRYSGLIYDDRATDITFSCEQEKVAHRAEEETIISITYVHEHQIINLLDRAKDRKMLELREKEGGNSL